MLTEQTKRSKQIEIICESAKLRRQIPLSEKQLMIQLDRIGIRPYQFDVGPEPENEIMLRLSFELLKQLVEMQGLCPLEVAPVVGMARGLRGRVLHS